MNYGEITWCNPHHGETNSFEHSMVTSHCIIITPIWMQSYELDMRVDICPLSQPVVHCKWKHLNQQCFKSVTRRQYNTMPQSSDSAVSQHRPVLAHVDVNGYPSVCPSKIQPSPSLCLHVLTSYRKSYRYFTMSKFTVLG